MKKIEPMKTNSMLVLAVLVSFYRGFRFAVLFITVAEGPITFVLLTASLPS
jgi:hypothetical protein